MTNTTTNEVDTIECRDCQGTGYVDRVGYLDTDSVPALLDELDNIVTDHRTDGLLSVSRAERLATLGRITWLAGRVIWLESVNQREEEWQATKRKYAERLAYERGLDTPCGHCGVFGRACSWSQNPSHPGPGDCCPRCNHTDD